jgi:hypothetical protein
MLFKNETDFEDTLFDDFFMFSVLLFKLEFLLSSPYIENDELTSESNFKFVEETHLFFNSDLLVVLLRIIFFDDLLFVELVEVVEDNDVGDIFSTLELAETGLRG